MKHRVSAEDARFRTAFEAQRVDPEEFDHSAHVRLAYVYLCEHAVDDAVAHMRKALLAFLTHLGIGGSKYHETITRAWVMAVDHFMKQSVACSSYSDLVRQHPELLDSKIMLTHYTAEVLFSPAARLAFVEPDLQAIHPR